MNKSTIEKKCQVFIKQLRSFREAKNISQDKLAELTGLKQSNISRMEAGNLMPTLETIIRIAQALNFDLKIEDNDKGK